MHFPEKLKSFARAFLKARSSQRQNLWSLSAESEKLLGEAQHLFFLSGGFYPPLILLLAILVPKGRTSSALKWQEMLRASPLKPTKGSAFGNRKLLKKLEQNF